MHKKLMEDERKACFNSNVEGYGENKLRYFIFLSLHLDSGIDPIVIESRRK